MTQYWANIFVSLSFSEEWWIVVKMNEKQNDIEWEEKDVVVCTISLKFSYIHHLAYSSDGRYWQLIEYMFFSNNNNILFKRLLQPTS
jgi:hypothetical protein